MTIELITAIPGGMAQWYSRISLTPRRERTLQIDLLPLQPLVRMVQITAVEDLVLTKAETAALMSVSEVAVAVFLKSWTLKDAAGEPVPLPIDADAVLDIEDRKLYDALIAHASKLLADAQVDGFSVDAVEDEQSPTVALDV